MKTFFCWFLFCVPLFGSEIQFDHTRPYLSALESRGRMDWADYQDDFLISQSAEISDLPSSELVQRLKNQHTKTILAWNQLVEKKFENFEIPSVVVSGNQLKGLNECNREKCSFKLHTDTETVLLINSKDKGKCFKEIVVKRLKDFLDSKQIKGYENRLNNIPAIKKAFKLTKFLQNRYPHSYQYLEHGLWNGVYSQNKPKGSYYRSEVVNITGDKMQPIYRISYHMEFEENGYLNVEIPLYTNHFFDSSIRIFEIFKHPGNPKKSIYVVTDLMEIDELKKSDLIRKLFKTPMEEAVSEFRKSEMKELR